MDGVLANAGDKGGDLSVESQVDMCDSTVPMNELNGPTFEPANGIPLVESKGLPENHPDGLKAVQLLDLDHPLEDVAKQV